MAKDQNKQTFSKQMLHEAVNHLNMCDYINTNISTHTVTLYFPVGRKNPYPIPSFHVFYTSSLVSRVLVFIGCSQMVTDYDLHLRHHHVLIYFLCKCALNSPSVTNAVKLD